MHGGRKPSSTEDVYKDLGLFISEERLKRFSYPYHFYKERCYKKSFPFLTLKKKDLLVCVHVPMRGYLSADATGNQGHGISMEFELEVVVDQLWLLGTELWSCARAAHCFNC